VCFEVWLRHVLVMVLSLRSGKVIDHKTYFSFQCQLYGTTIALYLIQKAFHPSLNPHLSSPRCATTSEHDVGHDARIAMLLRIYVAQQLHNSLHLETNSNRGSAKECCCTRRLAQSCRSVVSLSHLFARPRLGRWVVGHAGG
jgi:hypothetical protein